MVGIAEVVGAAIVVGRLLAAVLEGVDILLIAVGRVAQFEPVVE